MKEWLGKIIVTLNIFESDERADEILCRLIWLSLLSMDENVFIGGEHEICSSCNDVLEEFCRRIESIRLIWTNWGWSLFVWSFISAMIDFGSCRGRKNVEKYDSIP